MTDSDKNPTLDSHKIKDDLLGLLTTLFNEMNEKTEMPEVGITLLTHGFLVSGKVISKKTYIAELEKTMGLDAKPFSEVLEEDKDAKNPELTRPSFIHLRSARFYHPGASGIPQNQGVLWRGRLAEIAGFNIGELEAEK